MTRIRVDGWAVIFGTASRGHGPWPVLAVYQITAHPLKYSTAVNVGLAVAARRLKSETGTNIVKPVVCTRSIYLVVTTAADVLLAPLLLAIIL